MADINWTISGRLRVKMAEDKLMAGSTVFAVTGDLQNAEVEVEGSSLESGGFASWGTTRTDDTGQFTLSVSKPNAPRRIRVRVRFRDDDLKVTAPAPGSDWTDLFTSPTKVAPPRVDIGTCTFKRTNDVHADDHYKRAATWYLCKTVINALVARDPAFAFKDRVTIVYPAKAINGSYANGLTRSVYINFVDSNNREPDFGDQWDVPTVLHEFMHIWNYDHNHGASNWLGAVTWDADGSTHSFQEKPVIAFHEGFAEYAKDELLHHIWGFDKPALRSRQGLNGFKRVAGDRMPGRVPRPLDTIDMVECNEDGVRQALHLLTTPDIYSRTFGTEDSVPPSNDARTVSPTPSFCPRPPDIDFWDVLAVFKPNADAGWPTAWEAKQSSGLRRFYDRAADILPGFDQATKELYLELLDRKSTVEPQGRCGVSVSRLTRDLP